MAALAVVLAVAGCGGPEAGAPVVPAPAETGTSLAPSPAGDDPGAPSSSAPGPQVPVRRATAPAASPAPRPVRLVVRAADVDMRVDPVGVLDDGTMEIPPDARRAGWYRFGPAPGSPRGSTVLAGHVDSRLTGIGPLAELRRARPGDEVLVTTEDGTVHRYTTVEVEKVPKQDAPLTRWFARDGDPRLVVITCGGAWRAEIGHYADNVVLTAEPVRG